MKSHDHCFARRVSALLLTLSLLTACLLPGCAAEDLAVSGVLFDEEASVAPVFEEPSPSEGSVAATDDGAVEKVVFVEPEPINAIYQTGADTEEIYTTDKDTEPTVITTASDFSDVPEDAWYLTQLQSLMDMGGINGFDDGTFRPDDPVTVEQLIKIIVGCIMPEEQIDLYASSGGTWSSSYILAAQAMGALNGVDLSQAHLTAPASRWEAAWLQVSFARARGETLTAPEGIERAVTDWKSIPALWQDAVGTAFGIGLLTGYPDGSFCGEAQVRRCEAVVMIMRLLDASLRIPAVIPEYQYDYYAPVPACDPVDDSFFDDAIFVGNSLVDGFHIYSGLTHGTFIGATSVSVYNLWDAGREATLTYNSFGKVYIMLGVNEIGAGTTTVVSEYSKIITKLKQLQPNAEIYLQACLPVCESMLSSTQISWHVSNYYVQELNAALLRMCGEQEIYYVDTWSALADAYGTLPASMCWDGVHLQPAAYTTWLNCLRTHAVN